VVDAIQDRVKVFDRGGQLLIYFGEHGEYPGRFMGAFGITIDNIQRPLRPNPLEEEEINRNLRRAAWKQSIKRRNAS